MNFVEFWLLDNALEKPLPLFHLWSEFDEYAVSRLWRFPRGELIAGLEALLAHGYIKVCDGQAAVLSPTTSEWNELLDSECHAYKSDGWIPPTYRLTDAGGKMWEQLSEPNWNGYVSVGWPDMNEDSRGIIATSATTRERITEYLSGLTANHPWTVVPGTDSWEMLSPFQVTYWKTLPTGMRLTCQAYYDHTKPSTGVGYRNWWDSNWTWRTPPAFAMPSN